MVAAGHNNTAIAAPGLPDRRHRDIRSTRRVRTAGREGAGRRRGWRRTRGGVLCAGPPDQSRKQAVDGRAGLARRSKRVGIDVGTFGLVAPGWHSEATLGRHPLGGRVRITRPVGHPHTRAPVPALSAAVSTTRTRITKPAGIDGERTQRSNSARSRCDIHARRQRHTP
jgi:hypothetical protein